MVYEYFHVEQKYTNGRNWLTNHIYMRSKIILQDTID